MTRQQALALAFLIAGGIYYWWTRTRERDGGGRGISGSMLELYTRDLTATAKAGGVDVVIGRDEEIERVMHILTRRAKNNPLLLGEPGVGKTAVVEGIANRIAQGNVPERLKTKRMLALDLGALIGGTKYRGEFEERLKKLTKEIKAKERSIILFIDEVHMVQQAKGAEGAINVSDILKPELARGDLQMIGATTWKEYNQYIKPDDALNRRLQPVIIGEPSEEAALHILHGVKSLYEKHHQVEYTEKALLAAVRLSKEYIQDRFLPDKAIDLMDEAGAKVAIEGARGWRQLWGVLHAAGASAQERLKRLQQEQERLTDEVKHLEKLEQDWKGESLVHEARLRLEDLLKAIQHVEYEKNMRIENGVPQVTDKDIREIVADWVGQDVDKVV